MPVARVLAAFSFALAATWAGAQGIPVYDASAVLKAIEQLQAWAKQYEQMKEQIQVQRDQLARLTGSRNLGAILDGVAAEATVAGDIAARWRALAQHEQLVDAALGATERALAATASRGAQVRALMAAINATDDPKSIAELQARIQAEVALVGTDMQRIQLMQMQRETQQRRIDEEFREEGRRQRARPLATW